MTKNTGGERAGTPESIGAKNQPGTGRIKKKKTGEGLGVDEAQEGWAKRHDGKDRETAIHEGHAKVY